MGQVLALAFHGHLLLLVLAPSPHSSGRGFGPRRSSGTLQLSTRCSVARLDAESLLGSAGRLVVAPYVLGKRCHIGRGSTPSVGVASTPRRGAEHASAVLPRGSSAGLRATGSTM